MRRPIFKMLAFALGSSALIIGASSCEKDEKEKEVEDDEEVICCTWAYYQQVTEVCEGDQNPLNNQQILTGEDWDNFKTYVISNYGATCE